MASLDFLLFASREERVIRIGGNSDWSITKYHQAGIFLIVRVPTLLIYFYFSEMILSTCAFLEASLL